MVNHNVTAQAAQSAGVSTAMILCGLTLTSVFLPSDSARDVYSFAAISVGLSLSLATVIEGRAGIRKLIRVDFLMLWVLYGLTFFEFLFPQLYVDALVSPADAANGT